MRGRWLVSNWWLERARVGYGNGIEGAARLERRKAIAGGVVWRARVCAGVEGGERGVVGLGAWMGLAAWGRGFWRVLVALVACARGRRCLVL
jgi:hypothetical protein